MNLKTIVPVHVAMPSGRDNKFHALVLCEDQGAILVATCRHKRTIRLNGPDVLRKYIHEMLEAFWVFEKSDPRREELGPLAPYYFAKEVDGGDFESEAEKSASRTASKLLAEKEMTLTA